MAPAAQTVRGTTPKNEGVSLPFRADLTALRTRMKGQAPTEAQVLEEINAQYQRRHPGAPKMEWVGTKPADKALWEDVQKGFIVVQVRDTTLKSVDAKTAAGRDAFAKKLPPEERASLEAEVDRRYGQKTQSTDKPATPEEKAYREALRQDLLKQRQALEGVPPHVRDFLLSQEGPAGPVDPETLKRVAAKLSTLSPAELADYASRVTGNTTDLGDFEASVDRYRQERTERTDAADSLRQLQTRLTTPAQVYSDYNAYRAQVDSNEGLFITGSSAAVLEDKLKAELPQHGFADIPAYEKSLKDFRAGFEQEARALGEAQLTRYAHDLFAAESRYADPTVLNQALDPARKLYEQAKALRAKADLIERPPNASVARPQGDVAKLRADANSLVFKAEGLLKNVAEGHPLLARDLKFAQRLAQVPAGETSKLLKAQMDQRRQDIATTRAKLRDDPKFLYGLDNLLAASRVEQGLQPGSLPARMIDDHLNGKRGEQVLKDVAVASVLVGAGLLSGGAGIPGLVVAGVSAGVSAYQAKEALEQYQSGVAANNTGLSSQEPSFGWVVLAMAGAAVDLGGVAKAARVLDSMTDAVREFNAARNLGKLEQRLKTVPGMTPRVQEQVMEAARNEARLQQQVKGLLTRGGPIQVREGAAPDARLGELSGVARSLAERGEDSFGRFLQELKTNKLIDGEPSTGALKRLKEVYEDGVQQAKQARKAAETKLLDGLEDAKPTTTPAAKKAPTPEVPTPKAKAPEVKTPKAKAPEVPTSKVKTSDVKTPEVKTPVKPAPVAGTGPKEALEEYKKIAARFDVDDDFSTQDMQAQVLRTFEKSGGDAEMARTLKAMSEQDPSTFNRAFAIEPLGVLFELGASKNPELVQYARRVLANTLNGTLRPEDMKSALRDATFLSELPPAGPVREITDGYGASGRLFVGERDGKPLVFKTDNKLDLIYRDPSTYEVDLTVRALESYQGPKYAGQFRVTDPATGLWRQAVGMDKVEGQNLGALLDLQASGKPLPFPITERHIEALHQFEEALRRDGVKVSDTTWGDFFLTPDPKRPLAPLDMLPVQGQLPTTGIRGPEGKRVEDVLRKLMKAPSAKPQP
ncbi:hypothetical protein D7V88_07990 [Corallococcus terminator]|uniref:Uncharacterized protein n=2 Tax=Corallococcus terminator TaxID=2316733 RepID=A0A3A8J8W5_9BACT|nr:hypothetical protein D7V88_07990 [Corallococcus terminator]